MADDEDIDVWEVFSSDYQPVAKLPKTTPNTVEEMAGALEILRQKYGALNRIPYQDCITPTHMFFDDLCRRLLALEQKETDNE